MHARVGGQAVLVGRPAGTSIRELCLDIAELFDRARREDAAAWLLSPRAGVNETLLALRPRDGRRVEPADAARAWLLTRWRVTEALSRMAARATAAAATFWLEMYRELRRHIGDERLPYPLRTRLRGIAERCFRRSREAAFRPDARSEASRCLPAGAGAELPSHVTERLASHAARLGVAFDHPVVALEVCGAPELFHDAVLALVADGHTVVRIGDPRMGPLGYSASHANGRPAVIDLAAAAGRDPAISDPGIDVFILLKARFVVCGSPGMQAMACLTSTPCLLIGAIDPVASYPARGDGLFTLKAAVERDTGRVVPVDELLTERYIAHLDDFAHRANAATEVTAAVREMYEGVAHGWTDSAGQLRFRSRVAGYAAGRAGASVDGGAIDAMAAAGQGRLARVQADRP